VALLVLVGERDGLVNLLILERSGHLWRKLSRLIARCRVSQEALDHDRRRPDGHQNENDDHHAGNQTHGAPDSEWSEVERGGLAPFREDQGKGGQGQPELA